MANELQLGMWGNAVVFQARANHNGALVDVVVDERVWILLTGRSRPIDMENAEDVSARALVGRAASRKYADLTTSTNDRVWIGLDDLED